MNKRNKNRAFLVGGATILLFLTLIFHLFNVQVSRSAELVDLAKNVWETSRQIQAVRGAILDRHDDVLSFDAPSFTVAINPIRIHEKNQEDLVVTTIGPIIKMNETKLRSLVNKKRSNGKFYGQVELRNEGWQIDAIVADKVRKAIETKKMEGVFLMDGKKRFYPYQTMAAQVLGYLHKEGGAIGGLEKGFNQYLQGQAGSVSYEKDLKGVELPSGKVTINDAHDGKTIRTTIDRNIQQFLEQAMEKTVAQYHPKSMVGIVVDPQTMEILALSNRPNFNPNEYWKADDQANFYDHAIASRYEPGSTFKVVTLSGAVEEGVFDPNEEYMSGQIHVPGATIRDHNRTGWGKITFLEGLQRSSNIAFVKLGYERLGEDKLRDYINRFGFNEMTGIDLPGEVAGKVKFKYPSEVATATFGQGGVAVTPLQQVSAYAVIANGGKLMRPYIVKQIIDPKTNAVIQENGPKVIRQVVSAQTARKVTEFLETVVNDPKKGTGKLAAINGYRVAGKTGTAQKVVDGVYSANKWVLSFIGYAPAENPKLLCGIIIDEPDTGGSYLGGGTVAAPVFQDVMSKSLLYLGVRAEGGKVITAQPEEEHKAPELKGMEVTEAQKQLTAKGMQSVLLGNGQTVLNQFPHAGAKLGLEQPIYLISAASEALTLPDMHDRSYRDVLEMCTVFKASCRIDGEGYVAEQNIVDSGTRKWISFLLKPLSVVYDPSPLTSPLPSTMPDDQADEGPSQDDPNAGATMGPALIVTATPLQTSTSTPRPRPRPEPTPTDSPSRKSSKRHSSYLE